MSSWCLGLLGRDRVGALLCMGSLNEPKTAARIPNFYGVCSRSHFTTVLYLLNIRIRECDTTSLLPRIIHLNAKLDHGTIPDSVEDHV